MKILTRLFLILTTLSLSITACDKDKGIYDGQPITGTWTRTEIYQSGSMTVDVTLNPDASFKSVTTEIVDNNSNPIITQVNATYELDGNVVIVKYVVPPGVLIQKKSYYNITGNQLTLVDIEDTNDITVFTRK